MAVCWDNAQAKSAAAKVAVGDWIERVYNRRRRHSAIAMMSPVNFERPTHSDGTSRLTLCPPNGVKPTVVDTGKQRLMCLKSLHTVPVIYRKYVRRVIALAGVVGFLGMSAPASWGAPGDSDTPVADSPTMTMTLTDLGYGSTLAFYGLQGTQDLTLPILHGLRPAALNATAVVPVNLRAGLIIVTQNEREIARLNLPTTDQTPIVIPLAGATVIDDSVTLTLRAYLLPLEGNCVYPWSPLSLVNGMVSYTGVEQPPVTVAHFLPPVLRKLTIFVPQSPSVAEADATVQLAAAAAARYGKQAPEIAVLPLAEGQAAPPTPPRPLERQIVVKEGPDNGLSLQGSTGVPWLLISGPLGAAAESDTALLFGNLSQLALASKAVVGSLKSSL
jgi:hypothetical protein